MDRYDLVESLIPFGVEVLDYGCGSGHFCKRLNSKGIDTLGVDLDTLFTIEQLPDGTFWLDLLTKTPPYPFGSVVEVEIRYPDAKR